jgi:hypothetical protein
VICIIDEDNKQSFMFDVTGTKKERQLRAVELARDIARLTNPNYPNYKGSINLSNRCDNFDMIIVSFGRAE